MVDVVLMPMTEEEQAVFVHEEIANHAEQRVSEGLWRRREALERAQEELGPVLEREHGAAAAAGHRLWTAISLTGESVGWLWVTPSTTMLPPDGAFLYQITVKSGYRRRGYGKAMLAALERLLAEDAVSELRLNVNEANEPAKRLYEQAGYELVAHYETKRQLRKSLTRQRPVRGGAR